MAQLAYQEGQQVARQGKPIEALALFQSAQRQEPYSAKYRIAVSNTKNSLALESDRGINPADGNGQLDDAKAMVDQASSLPRDSEKVADRLHQLQSLSHHSKWIQTAKTLLANGDGAQAKAVLSNVLIEDPGERTAIQMMSSIEEAELEKHGDSRLLPSDAFQKSISFEFKDAPISAVFEVISRSSGIHFLFDREVKKDQKASFYLRNSSIEQAIRLTLMVNQLEQQILNGNTIMVYPRSPAKIREYQPLKMRVFYLSNAEAKTVAASIKTLLKTRDLVTDNNLNMLIMRDTPEAISLAEKLVAAHDVAEPEVMLEVEVLEVSRKRLLELGVRLPEQIGLTPLSAAEKDLTLSDLWSAGRDQNGRTIGATVGSTAINARKMDSDSEILANPRIRVRNREKAKIVIGDRVPNITSTSSATGFLAESISYVDVGLKLDVEPTVYLDGEVGISVALEVSTIVDSLTTSTGSQTYRIGTRTAQTGLRLKDGETQVLAGLMSNDERKAATKVPALGDLPIAGRLFGSRLDGADKTEILLAITPRILRNIQRHAATMQEFDSGTEARLDTAGVPAGGGPAKLPGSSAKTMALGNQGAAGFTTQDGHNRAAPPALGEPLPNGFRWQGPSAVRKGDAATIQLLMQTELPVVSLPLTIVFDPRAFQILAVTEGNFFKRGGKSNFTQRVDPSGQIILTITASAGSGSAGSGVLTKIDLKVLESASSEATLGISAMAPVGLDAKSLAVQPPKPFVMKVEP